MKKHPYILLILSLLLAALPLLSVLIAGFAAHLFGCELNEGSVPQCPTIFGDIGSLLYTMGVFGWFIFYTLPLGVIGVGMSVALLAIKFFRKKKETSL
jgi:hypothetical protein